ncbi:MAG: MFS transporter [Alphaproteobacteria bacterium]
MGNPAFIAVVAALIIQVVPSLIAYGVPIAAPEAVGELGIEPASVGLYTSLLYGVATLTALTCPGLIARHGAIRVAQICFLFCAAGLVIGAGGFLSLVILSAVVIGIGYGPPGPVAVHILANNTSPRRANLLFSIKQTGVPGGAALAGILVPVLVLALGWRGALAAMAVIPLVLSLILIPARARLDAERQADAPLFRGGVLEPLKLVLRDPAIRWLCIAGMIFAGVQLCFGTFWVVFLVEVVRVDLITAGVALSALQLSGVVSRVIMGWVADRFVAPRFLLAGVGFSSGATALLIATMAPGWSVASILAVSVLAGAASAAWSGIAFAEAARIAGPEKAASAAGGMTFMMYGGVVFGPSGFTGLVSITGGFDTAFVGAAIVSILGGILILVSPGVARGKASPA